MKTRMTTWILTGAALAALAAPAAAQVEIRGFVESGTGVRLGDVSDPPAEWGALPPEAPVPAVWGGERDFLLRETRLQLKGDVYGDVGEAHFVVDLLADQVAGSGADVVIREGYAKFNAFADHLEVRAGRQPTTWGTGDLLFINDLFPKDYVSFFVGREDQYLKGPSDAVRLGIFGLPVNLDVVYTPQFTPDNLPSGERLAFWTPAFVPSNLPADELENGELAMRASRYFGSYNVSAYGYVGRWKSPQGMMVDGGTGMPTGFYHPELNVYGASVRGPLFGGVAWAEGGYYDSREDSDGSDPTVPNSETRAMVGYERQWWSDFTGGMQFYWEGMQDHDVAREALDTAFGPEAYMKDENRTLITMRLMQMMRYQTVTATAFGFYSPSDEDAYVRLSLSYDYSDQLELTVGSNLFLADDTRTLFGMNDENDNLYVRARYSF